MAFFNRLTPTSCHQLLQRNSLEANDKNKMCLIQKPILGTIKVATFEILSLRL